MIFIQLLVGAIILFIIYELIRSMIRFFKERKELDRLFIKS